MNMIGEFQQIIECIFEWIFVIGDISFVILML